MPPGFLSAQAQVVGQSAVASGVCIQQEGTLDAVVVAEGLLGLKAGAFVVGSFSASVAEVMEGIVRPRRRTIQ